MKSYQYSFGVIAVGLLFATTQGFSQTEVIGSGSEFVGQKTEKLSDGSVVNTREYNDWIKIRQTTHEHKDGKVMNNKLKSGYDAAYAKAKKSPCETFTYAGQLYDCRTGDLSKKVVKEGLSNSKRLEKEIIPAKPVPEVTPTVTKTTVPPKKSSEPHGPINAYTISNKYKDGGRSVKTKAGGIKHKGQKTVQREDFAFASKTNPDGSVNLKTNGRAGTSGDLTLTAAQEKKLEKGRKITVKQQTKFGNRKFKVKMNNTVDGGGTKTGGSHLDSN